MLHVLQLCLGVAVLSMWLLRFEEQKWFQFGLTPDMCCAWVSIAVVGSYPNCVPCDERQTQQFAALLWLDPCFVASLWNRVTGQDLTCREGCGAGCPGWNVCCQFAAFPDSVCLAHKLHNRISDVHGEPISFWSQGYGACHHWSAVSVSGLHHKYLLCFCILYGILILSFICEIRTFVMNKLVCRCWMGYFCLWFCLLWHLGSINWVNCVDSFCSTDAYVMLSYKMS